MAAGVGRKTGKTPAEKDGKIRDVYPWGKQWPPAARAGNYAGEETGPFTSMISGYKDGFSKTAPVGSFAASAPGLFDLGGNVWEWCENFLNGTSGPRVRRSASFRESEDVRLFSSARFHADENVRLDHFGFRCVLAEGPAPR